MSNKTFIPDYTGLTLTEKNTWHKPDFRDYDHGIHYQNALVSYTNHLASLRTFPAPWLPDSGPEEMVEGVHFAFRYERRKGAEWKLCTELEYGNIDNSHRRIVTVPLPRPLEGAKEEGEELPKPYGDFILDNAKGIQLADGMYYHYSQVCHLIKKYDERYALESPYKQSTPAPVQINADEIDPRVIKNYLIEKGELEYAEHFMIMADRLYDLEKQISQPAPIQGEALYPASFTEWAGSSASFYNGVWYLNNDFKIKTTPYTTAELYAGPYQEYLQKQKGGNL